MHELPSDVSTYSRTPTFTENTIPKGVLNNHKTKAGVWGLLTVETGEIGYIITEPGQEEKITVTEDQPGVIAPEQLHHVEVQGSVRFHVQFLR